MIDETEKLVLQTFAQTFVCREVNIIKNNHFGGSISPRIY